MVDRVPIDEIPDPEGTLKRLTTPVRLGGTNFSATLHPTEIEAWLARTTDEVRERVLESGVEEGKPGLPGFVGAAAGRINE